MRTSNIFFLCVVLQTLGCGRTELEHGHSDISVDGGASLGGFEGIAGSQTTGGRMAAGGAAATAGNGATSGACVYKGTAYAAGARFWDWDPDSCAFCTCYASGFVACSSDPCEVCLYDPVIFVAGETLPAGDGCNTCTCFKATRATQRTTILCTNLDCSGN